MALAFGVVRLVLVVALGGVIGSLARYGVDEIAGSPDLSAWPWNTLAVNVLGALLIGALGSISFIADGPDWAWPLCVTGVLGGFTTFSAFALEVGVMLEAGRIFLAAGYVLVTLLAGLIAVRIGRALVGSRS